MSDYGLIKIADSIDRLTNAVEDHTAAIIALETAKMSPDEQTRFKLELERLNR